MSSVRSFARKFGLVVAATLAYLVAADLTGVALSFFFDLFGSERRTSAALYWAGTEEETLAAAPKEGHWPRKYRHTGHERPEA